MVIVRLVYRMHIGLNGQTSVNVLEPVLVVFKKEDELAHNPEGVLEKIKSKKYVICHPASQQQSQPPSQLRLLHNLDVLIKNQIVARIG